MAFNALVDLGTVGEDITGSTVSISGCTGSSCGSGCSSLATAQAVSGFPKTITGIPDNVVSLFVKVDNGLCSGTTQCISVTFVDEPTPTPTPTPTATSIVPTPTPTITPTATPIVATPTPTPTATPIIPTPTPTPTDTPVSCVDGVSFEVDSAGEVRYVTCEGITEYVTFGIGPQTIADCIENNSLFALGATISQISYGSPCVVPTPLPTPTPTPTSLIEYYRSNPSATALGHCNQNQLMTGPIYSYSGTITGMLFTTVYDGSQDPIIGGNLYYAVSGTSGSNTNDLPYYVIQIDDFGSVNDVQYITSCDGGGDIA
jgi:hypothetical protein